jgi:hypothetical protein
MLCLLFQEQHVAKHISFGNIHRPQISSPCVQVLENIEMDILKMLDIKHSPDWLLDQILDPQCRQLPLNLMQFIRIDDTELVFQNI